MKNGLDFSDIYCIAQEVLSILYSNSLYKSGHDILDILYFIKIENLTNLLTYSLYPIYPYLFSIE